jgi:ribose transport system permease protein
MSSAVRAPPAAVGIAPRPGFCAAEQMAMRCRASASELDLRYCRHVRQGRRSAEARRQAQHFGETMLGWMRSAAVTQERIVLLISVVLFCAFSFLLKGFLSTGNIVALVRSVATLGILGVGMALVVIGRGIDLTIVTTYAMSAALTFHLANSGFSLPAAMALGFLLALAVGVINGVLIAYVEIPALFATLGMASFVYGFVRYALVPLYVVYMPPSAAAIGWIGGGFVFGVPTPILFFAGIALLGSLFLRFTKQGRFVYAIGDNFLAARISGAPVRPIIVLQYTLSTVIAYVAGLITATAVSSMNTNIATSSMIYDVILVVVLGGIGLSGGRGGIRNVIVGTLLIGILLNGMTIMNIQYTMQNVIRSLILLGAIVLDSIVKPRDEQTAQQGDI